MTSLRAAVLLLLGAALLGCGGGDEGEAAGAEPRDAVTLSPENIAIAQLTLIESGPRISGSLEAERQAAVRAELGGSLTQVAADVGQRVGAGSVLARIEDRSVLDAQLSAQSAVRSAEQAFRSAERNAERTRTLVQGGALAERDLEVAQDNLASVRAQLADARARLASANEQLSRTQVRTPIAGIVSERPVNAGDVVAPGTLLFSIVDPSSMRLLAAVPADALGSLRVGTSVEFQVRGYPNRSFKGNIERISPAADPITRQIPIIVSLPNPEGQLVAGLFADGRVAAQSRNTLVVPASAVEDGAGRTTVLRMRAGKIEEVGVSVGIRDERTERIEITAGLSPGDTVLIGAARGMTPGSPVTLRSIERAR